MSLDSERPRPDRFVVGEWTVTPSRNVIRRGEEEIRLEPRVMDTLVHFAGHPETIVTKDDLVAHIWNARHVSDEVLTVTVYALRKALGDDARRPKYIETVPRRGYRLIAPVTTAMSHLLTAPATAPSAVAVAAAPASRGRLMMVAALALAFVATAAVWRFTPTRHRRHVQSAEAHEAYLKGRSFLDQRIVFRHSSAFPQDLPPPGASQSLARHLEGVS